MVIIGLFALIGAVMGFFMLFSDLDPWGFWEGVFDSFISVITGAIGALVGGAIGYCIALSLPAKMENIDDKFTIVCLQDNSSVSGKFFLGSGNVNGSMKYTFYYNYNNGYKLCQLNTDKTTINYSDSAAIMVQHTNTMVNPKKAFVNYFAIDLEDYTYDIYVPKGTIKTNYNLDAQ